MFWIVLIVLVFIVTSMFNATDLDDEHEKKQSEEKLKITDCIAAIDVLCNVALMFEKQWTPEKVRLIKKSFEQICSNNDDYDYLKYRIKTDNRPNLEQSISNFLSSKFSHGNINTIYDYIVVLLLNTSNDKNVIYDTGIRIGKLLGLSSEQCYESISEYFIDDHENNNAKDESTDPNSNYLNEAAAILGIRSDANLQEIQAAYRSKIKDYHPDRNSNVTQAVRLFLEEQTSLINNARDTLIKNLK